MSATVRMCTFHLGEQLFGVEVERVQEILLRQDITRLPLSNPEVRGLINLRGQIVTAVDLRRCLGLPDRGPSDPVINVVVRDGGDAVSLLADSTGEVLEVAGDGLQPPPATLEGAGREFIRGAFPLPDRLLLALDLERILETAYAQGPRASQGVRRP